MAQSEWGAIQAAQQLQVTWTPAETLPDQADLANWIRQQPTSDKQPVSTGDVDAALASAATVLQATFSHPTRATSRSARRARWPTSSQPGDDLLEYAGRLSVARRDRPIDRHAGRQRARRAYGGLRAATGTTGSTTRRARRRCYPRRSGKPVRVQWMRQDEHVWEPHGPAMLVDIRGAVDAQGQVSGWDYQVWTPTHSTRPGGFAANLLPGTLVSPSHHRLENGLTGGDRNAPTNYTFANNRVTVHWLTASPHPGVGPAQPGRDGQYLRQRVVHG